MQSGDVFAGFVIDRPLGSGGMGVVYLARHPRLERDVALKVLNDSLATDPKARNAFEREAALAARFDHPNIVAVYDRNGPDDPQLWLSMQYVGGGDANDLLAASPGGLPTELVVDLITGAADGLDVAHAEGVLHRDVKPANLLLGADPRRTMLTDFGIARALDESVTPSTLTVTFAYAAPERFLAQPSDHRTDIYSLGCTLHQLLTGQPPYPRATHAAVMMAHLNDPPPSPHALRPELPAAIDTVIAAALAKHPGERYSSCGALAEAAGHALADASPASTPEACPPASVVRAVAPDAATVDSIPRAAAGAISPVPGSVAPPTPAPISGPSGSGKPTRKPVRRGRFAMTAGVLLGVAVLMVALGIAVLHESGPASGPDVTPRPAAGPPTVAATIPVGAGPDEIAFVPDTPTAVVSNTGDGTVSMIDTNTRTVTDTVRVGAEPAAVAVDAAQRKLYVANRGDSTVSVIDLADRNVVTDIRVGYQPWDITVDASTHTAYATNRLDDTVSVIDTNTDTVRRSIPLSGGDSPVGETAGHVVVDPVTHRAFATGTDHHTVTVIEPDTDEFRTVPAGTSPGGALVDPDTHTAYIANYHDQSVTAINTQTLAVTGTIATDVYPDDMAIDPGTHTLYLLCQEGTLSKIDTTTNTVAGTLRLSPEQDALAFDPHSQTAYTTSSYSDDVTAIDTAAFAVLPERPAQGTKPQGVHVDPATGRAYVPSTAGNSVSVISR